MKTNKQVLSYVPMLLFSLCLCVFVAQSSRAGDWLHWRGPQQNGVSFDKNLPEKFSVKENDANSNLIWTKPYGCRSTPVVLNGRVFILNNAGEGISEGERFMCFDAATGKVLWEDKFNVFHSDIVSNRIGWSSPAGDPETGNVYIHGTQGFLRCYNADGKILWQHNLTEEYGRVTGYGGRVVGPVVDENLVIVGMINGSWGDYARGANRFVAFDKKNGNVVWWSAIPDQINGTYYSTPVVATINGVRLLIAGGADGALHAMQVRTGKQLWSYQFCKSVVNSSPVVDGHYVYCSHGMENLETSQQGRLVCVDASQIENGHPKLVWEVIGTKFDMASPVIHDGVVYICNDSARLFRYDAKTGKPIGRATPYGTLARGSPVWGDGKIYVFDVNGKFHILKPGQRDVEELHAERFRTIDGAGFVETNGTPAIANGRIYFGTRDAFYCIGTKDGQAGEAPASPTEAKGDETVAQLLLYPADVAIPPGGSAEFEVRAFNSLGQPLTVKPKGEWGIALPPKQPDGRQPPALDGTLTPTDSGKAKLVVSAKMPGQQGYVEFTVDKISTRARVRVVPQLPYTQDFEKVPIGAAPGGWVNTMGKYNVIEKDGAKVLRKLANSSNPAVARADGFIGLPNWSDYTIQADVNGQMVRGSVADIGLMNCRYRLLLDGKRDPDDKKRRLHITAWEARPRIDHAMAFDWQPDTWYTMKFKVEVGEKSAHVRGKVWERGKPEPEAWTIEFEDPSPNREGAPAIYAYVSNALEKQVGSEAYFDNVRVTPNKPAAKAPAATEAKQAAAEVPAKVRLADIIRVRGEPRPPTQAPAAASAGPLPVLGTPVGGTPNMKPDNSGKAIVAQAVVVREGQSLDNSSDRRPVRRYVRLSIAIGR